MNPALRALKHQTHSAAPKLQAQVQQTHLVSMHKIYYCWMLRRVLKGRDLMETDCLLDLAG